MGWGGIAQQQWSWSRDLLWKSKEIKALGIVHEDLRRDSILWNEELGRALIIDFHPSTLRYRPSSRAITRKETSFGNRVKDTKRLRILWEHRCFSCIPIPIPYCIIMKRFCHYHCVFWTKPLLNQDIRTNLLNISRIIHKAGENIWIPAAGLIIENWFFRKLAICWIESLDPPQIKYVLGANIWPSVSPENQEKDQGQDQTLFASWLELIN